MTFLLLLLDVVPNTEGVVPWGGLILFFVIVFILAVGFTAGLVFLLVRLKRRKLKQAEVEGRLPV